MKILIVGADRRGSWEMRGVQLGRTLGARATTKPSASDWAWAEIVVLVKRAALAYATEAKSVRVPVVWDALDFWQQPDENGLAMGMLIADALKIKEAAGVSVIVGATRQMAFDLGGVYLPHHCRIGLQPTAPRETATVIGYDGTRKYLGKWRRALEEACARARLAFVDTPHDLRACDALVSLRYGLWDGEGCGEWKSGVKQVNAIASGRPILAQPSAAQRELGAIGPVITAVNDLMPALDTLVSRETREQAYEHGRTHAQKFTVEAVAAQYREMLRAAIAMAA